VDLPSLVGVNLYFKFNASIIFYLVNNDTLVSVQKNDVLVM